MIMSVSTPSDPPFRSLGRFKYAAPPNPESQWRAVATVRYPTLTPLQKPNPSQLINISHAFFELADSQHYKICLYLGFMAFLKTYSLIT